jgi:class 3 adenylate cyclase
MYSQVVKRKLTAILSADVEGYSRLMGEDEVGTIRILTVHRDAMTDLIHAHNGRVVDAPGDNLLAEFASVVNAVQCAFEYFYRFTREDNLQSRKLFEEAIALDPYYAAPYSLLGWTHLNSIYFSWTDNPLEELRNAGL